MARDSKSVGSKENIFKKNCYFVKKSGKINKNFKNYKLPEKVKILKNYEPANLQHVKILSKYLKRCINIRMKDNILIAFGKYVGRPKIDLEFIKNPGSKIGHFTSKAGWKFCQDKSYPNNCLFDAISTQTGMKSNVLRQTVQYIQRKGPKTRCKKKSAFFSLPYLTDLIGGATYHGESKRDAKEILDSSQNGQSHPDKRSGHPRGHASHPKATGYYDSVENYSKYDGRKTGFLSRTDQDIVAHLTLKTSEVRDTMELLNHLGKKANKLAVDVYPKRLQMDEDKLPLAQEWVSGESKGKPTKINKLVMVLKHFYNKYDDEDEDPFVLTFYPTI